MIDHVGGAVEIEVDGGITADNIAVLAEAGADVIVAGTSVYGRGVSIADAIAELRTGIASAPRRW